MSSNEPPPSRLTPTEKPAGGPAETPKPPSDTKAAPDQKAARDASAPPTKEAPAPAKAPTQTTDPLRGSRASGFWATVVILVVVLVLLAIFVLQNTRKVQIDFLGWSGSIPVAAAMMISAAAGLVVAVAAGSARILQLRRRVKRERKAVRPAK